MNITRKEFRAYRRVQKEGKYNMLTREALKASGLPEDKYKFIQKNYSNLMKAYVCNLLNK